MRKSKKFYLGILTSLVMACVIAVPAIAAEYDADVQSSQEGDAEVHEDFTGEAGDLSQEVVENQEETLNDTDASSLDDIEGGIVAEDKDEIDLMESAQENEEILEDVLSDEDAVEPEEDADEAEIMTLAVTNGFGQGEDGNWYYYTNGEIDTSMNSVIQGTVNGENAWWYVVEGKVQLTFTGLADYSNSNGWWYIENGKVSFTYNGVEHNRNGWFYVKNSKVDFSYNGFAQNSNGWWYIESGKVTFNKNSVIQGTVNGTNAWWYVVGSKVQTGFTGLADYSNSNGWWYIENGKVSFTYEGVEHNKNGWFYVKDSKVQFSYNGFAKNSNGWWYIESGKVTFNKNSVIQGTVNGTKAWWYVVGSKVQTGFTGLADYSNSNGWWYIEDGKVTFTKDTIAHNKNGWYYVKDSKVDFSFTGLADFPNENGWWYCENGKVTFSKNTIAHNKNGWWYVKDSKVDFNFTGLADFSNENGWWYCENGKVLFNHTGVEKNKNGWYYVKDSKVDFSYTGIAQNKNGWWYIEKGQVLFNDLMTSAAQYLGAHTSSSLSNAERLKACSDYMYHHYNFESTNGVPTASSLNSYAEYFFKYDSGACYHHTAGLACMAKALGFDTIFHEGYISDDTYGMMMHSWCEVYVNGQWLIYDPGQGYAAQKESDIDRVFETRNEYRLTISNGETVWTKL